MKLLSPLQAVPVVLIHNVSFRIVHLDIRAREEAYTWATASSANATATLTPATPRLESAQYETSESHCPCCEYSEETDTCLNRIVSPARAASTTLRESSASSVPPASLATPLLALRRTVSLAPALTLTQTTSESWHRYHNPQISQPFLVQDTSAFGSLPLVYRFFFSQSFSIHPSSVGSRSELTIQICLRFSHASYFYPFDTLFPAVQCLKVLVFCTFLKHRKILHSRGWL